MNTDHPTFKPQKPQQCDLCGEIEELRPYGKDGACVCFDCAMKDEAEAVMQMAKQVYDIDLDRKVAETVMRLARILSILDEGKKQ